MIMGNQREYLESGGFSRFLYEDHPDFQPFEFNGLKAKVIKLIADPDGNHSGLPSYANSSNIYLRVDKFGRVSSSMFSKTDWKCPLLLLI